MFDNYVPQWQLDDCSVTRSFLSTKGVACETNSYMLFMWLRVWLYDTRLGLPSNGLITKLPWKRGRLASKGWVTRMLIVSRHAPTTSSVTFNCLLSSQSAQHRANLNTQWQRAGNQGGATIDQTSLLGDVWVWQHNNDWIQSRSHSFRLWLTNLRNGRGKEETARNEARNYMTRAF